MNKENPLPLNICGNTKLMFMIIILFIYILIVHHIQVKQCTYTFSYAYLKLNRFNCRFLTSDTEFSLYIQQAEEEEKYLLISLFFTRSHLHCYVALLGLYPTAV